MVRCYDLRCHWNDYLPPPNGQLTLIDFLYMCIPDISVSSGSGFTSTASTSAQDDMCFVSIRRVMRLSFQNSQTEMPQVCDPIDMKLSRQGISSSRWLIVCDTACVVLTTGDLYGVCLHHAISAARIFPTSVLHVGSTRAPCYPSAIAHVHVHFGLLRMIIPALYP